MRLRALRTAVCATLYTFFLPAVPLAAGQERAAPASAAESSYFDDKEKGWFWYEDPPPAARRPADPPAMPAPAEKTGPAARFEAFKKAVEEARIRVFVEPTPENVRRYAELQNRLVRQASLASEVWQRVMWANPQWDFTQERPVNSAALAARNEAQNKLRRETYERLAKTSVLFFFFKSDCPYCHAFAPVLQAFSGLTGITVFPVSLDGGGLPQYPFPRRDNGMAARLGVETVPALYLGDPASGRIAPVGFGVLSEVDLADRLVEIANPNASAHVGAATPTDFLDLEQFK